MRVSKVAERKKASTKKVPKPKSSKLSSEAWYKRAAAAMSIRREAADGAGTNEHAQP